MEFRAHRTGSVSLERLHVTQRVAGLGPSTFLARFSFLLDHHPSPFCPRVLEPHLEERKTPCSQVGGYQNSEEPQCVHLHYKSSLVLSNYNNNNLGFEALVKCFFVLNFLRHQAGRMNIINWSAICEDFSLYQDYSQNCPHLYQKRHHRKQQ